MRSIIKLNPNEQDPVCAVCVYSETREAGLFCVKRKKEVEGQDTCKKFSLDITAITARRRHSINKEKLNPEDFSID